MRSLVCVALANRSSVRVEGSTLPLSSRATNACVVPIAAATCSCVRSASPRALINADARANSSSSASYSARNFGVFHPFLRDLLDGNILAGHLTSFARLRAISISRRGVFCVFFTKTCTTTTRCPDAVT